MELLILVCIAFPVVLVARKVSAMCEEARDRNRFIGSSLARVRARNGSR